MEDTLSEVISSLPPGFRFHATDEELLILYLKPKILGLPDEPYYEIIPEIDVCEFEPWQLLAKFDPMFNRKELFFYCRVKRKYSNSRRSDRTTGAGYWKVTGKERAIMSEDTNEQIGTKKTLVFYLGRVPRGKRTNWVMHEYHLNSKCLGDNHSEGEMLPYVACRIKNKKEKKQMMGHAPTINPEGYSSSPYTGASDVSDPPGNQEGELLSFCNTPNNNNEVADNQGAADVQPKMPERELLESLTLDDYVSKYNNDPEAAIYAQPEMLERELMEFTLDDNVSEYNNNPEAAIYAQPEMLERKLMESLSLDDNVSESNNAPEAAIYAQPKMSLEEIMNLLPPLVTLDDNVSDYINTPNYQPQPREAKGPSPFSDYGYMPSPCSNFSLDGDNV